MSESVAEAAFRSWSLDGRLIGILLAVALVYLRGWRRSRRKQPAQLYFFTAGLLTFYLATDSPLDTLDALYLSAHMTQHLLLLMLVPALLLLGDPAHVMLMGLPKVMVKEVLAPFLTWRPLHRFLGWLVSPPVAFLAFTISMFGWHLPALYELALRSPAWHSVQHACFFWSGILFWWPVMRSARWFVVPYLLLADILNTILSAFFVFSDRVFYPHYLLINANPAAALQDQSAAGAIMWVPGSIVFLVPAIGIAMRLLAGDPVPQAVGLIQIQTRRPALPKVPWLAVRRAARFGMLVLALAVMADGFFGTQTGPLNLAGVLPWTWWRPLSVFALLGFGNLFCMVCPFTLVRDFARRFAPRGRRWPARLRTKWIAAGLIALYLWAYEAFSLWDSPWLTAWIIAGYFCAALMIDLAFRGATFCKYVCPIGQFHFVASLVSPSEVGVVEPSVCRTCRTHDCIRGNQQSRGCELSLFQPKKIGNMDCTFCLDCVAACPHGNVAMRSASPLAMSERFHSRRDVAALVAVFVTGAFINAAGMVLPHQLFVLSALLVMAVALASGLAPTARRFVFTLVPIGVAMWCAHLLFHFVTAGLGVPHLTWLPASQILLLDAGLLFTFFLSWRCAASQWSMAAPWFALAGTLYAAGIWILLQPMPMRGMLH